MFKGAIFGTRFREAHAYREPDLYPTETSHDVTTDRRSSTIACGFISTKPCSRVQRQSRSHITCQARPDINISIESGLHLLILRQIYA